MRTRMARIVAGALVAVAALTAPALAHHGSAVSYDIDIAKLTTVTGTVTEWVWRNPHCFIMLDVKGADGNVVKWTAETSSTQSMQGEHGWSRTTLKPGDVITVTVFPSRAGTTAGLLYKVVAADGKVLIEDESRLPRGQRPTQ